MSGFARRETEKLFTRREHTLQKEAMCELRLGYSEFEVPLKDPDGDTRKGIWRLGE